MTKDFHNLRVVFDCFPTPHYLRTVPTSDFPLHPVFEDHVLDPVPVFSSPVHTLAMENFGNYIC